MTPGSWFPGEDEEPTGTAPTFRPMVNIAYNAVRIVNSLPRPHQDVFAWLVLGYNLLMYPLCLVILSCRVVPVWRTWRELGRLRPVSGGRLATARRRVLGWPLWAVGVSCLGWLPGGLFFPLAISCLAGPVGAEVFGHFAVSFTVSGLIALTYSFFAVQFAVLRVFYCRLWADGQDFGVTARREVGSLGPRLRRFQLLAGMIPLAGAVLMVGVGPEIARERTFRLLLAALIALGMAGFSVAAVAHHVLSQTLAALTHTEDPLTVAGASTRTK